MKKSKKVLASAVLAATMLIGTGTVAQAVGPTYYHGVYMQKYECLAAQQRYARDRSWKVVVTCRWGQIHDPGIDGYFFGVQAAY